MSQILIEAKPTFDKDFPRSFDFLQIAEFYYDTIQGEGIYVGTPSTFLRLQGCTLNCHWCDTNDVWITGNPYTFDELFKMMDDCEIIKKFENGQHLVLTGGSPLMQQEALAEFLQRFYDKYKFVPIIEIENECTVLPSRDFARFVSCWNNSPKLCSSGNHRGAAYIPQIIEKLAAYPNSWFKFVIGSNPMEDWYEIEELYLRKKLIKRSQIILMPCGATQEQLKQTTSSTVQLAVREGVRYSPRLHIDLWDKKTGV